MDQDTLSKLTVSELKLLCSNRDLGTKGRIVKQTLINKLLSYHKKNNYKKLKFEKSLREWKKDELVLELRARGTKSGSRNKQHIAYKLMHNGQSPNKKKTKSILNESNQNKKKNKNKNQKTEKSKPRRKSKLKQKEEKMMKAYKALEAVNLHIFEDLQNDFKPVNLKTKLPHSYKDFDHKVEIPEDLGDELDSFGDKVLELLPLILEIHSISNDYIKYKRKIKKKQQGTKKGIYYVGMKKYKKKKHYNQDEVGPICGIFEKLSDFDAFKDDSSVKKQFGKKIARIRYVTKQQSKNKQNSNDSENDDNDIEMASDTEQQQKQKQISDEDVSEDESLSDDGDMIPSDEDEDTQDHITQDNDDNNGGDVAEIVITTEEQYENKSDADDTDSDKTESEDTDSEDTDDDDMDDMDVEINNDSNKNKNKTRNRNKSREVSKKPAMTKNTRSRREANKNKKVSGRKRRRDDNNNNDESNDELTENPKKRLKVNPISG